MNKNGMVGASKWVLIGLFCAITLVLTAGGYWFYRHEAEAIRIHEYNDLKVIADLKVDQIVRWRNERIADARLNSAAPFLRTAVIQWIKTPGDAVLKSRIKTRIQLLKETTGYENVILADAKGRILITLDPRLVILESGTKQVISRVMASHQIVFGDFFRCSICNQVHLDVAAPILDLAQKPVAVLILRNDPHNFLYPLIQSWPATSKSAETLLIRKEGNDVLFLNILRHRADPALTIRIPLTQINLPAVQAVRGKKGLFEGFDYRHVKAVTDIRPVPETPWFMVAKVDKGEILAEARERARLIWILTLVLVVLSGLGITLIYKHQGKRAFQALYRAEQKRAELLEEARVTLYSIGDAVITTGADGRVKQINPVAENLTGWKETEALGKPLSQVFHVVNEETRAEIENPVVRILREGLIVGLANHSLLIARDGTERPIADSGAPIRNETGEITGVVMVFRDQSAEREKIAQIIKSEEKTRLEKYFSDSLLNSLPGIFYLFDENGKFLRWNKNFEVISGLTAEEMAQAHPLDFFEGQDKELVAQRIGEVFTKGVSEAEAFFVSKYGSRRPYYFTGLRIDLDNKACLIGVGLDITERKKAEEALKESIRERTFLAELIEKSSQPLGVGFPDGHLGMVNQAFCDLVGYSREELMSIDWGAVLTPPEWLEAEQAKLEELHQTGRPVRYEKEYIRKDGTRVPIELFVHLVRDETGRPEYYYAFVTDIAGRKLVEGLTRLRLTLWEFSASHSLEELLQKTLDEVGALTGSHIGFYHFVESDQKTLALQAWSTRTIKEFCKAEGKGMHYGIDQAGVWVDCVRERRPVIHNDYNSLPHRKGMPEGHAQVVRELVVPIFRSGQIVAILGIGNKSVDYTQSDVEIVSYLADVAWEITERKRAQAALQVLSMHQEALLSAIPDIIMEVDENKVYTWANQAGYEFFGEEVIGKGADFYFEGEQETYITVQPLFNGQEDVIYLESWQRRKDGQIRLLAWWCRVLKDEKGNVRGALSSARDITVHKQAEEALRESEERYRQVVENANEAIIVIQDEMFRFFNSKTGEIFGYSEENPPPSFHFLANSHPEDRDMIREYHEKRLRGEKIPNVYSARIIDRQGKIKWVEINSVLISWEGKPATLVFLNDITERKITEEKIILAKEEWERTFDSVPDLIAVVDNDFQITRVNSAMAERLKRTPQELIGKFCYEMFHGLQRPPSYCPHDEIIRDKKEISAEFLDPQLGGYFFLTGTPLPGTNSVIHVFRDITDRKEAEEKVLEGAGKLRKAIEGIVQAMAATVEAKDPYTAGHQRRVADLSRAIAQEMGFSDDRIDGIHMAGMIHDLGKLSIPAEILSKPTQLTEIEFNLIKVHPWSGYEILKGIDFPWPIARIVFQHHERINGAGYPLQIKGEEILPEAKVLAVADVVEAIASHRPYRPAHGIDKALEEITKNKGILYDPEVVEVCLRIFQEKRFVLE